MYWQENHQLHNNKYIIKQELGQGAFGITYKAIQNTHLQLPVVIKTPNMRLKRDRQYSRYLEKFIQEAQLLGKLCQVPHQNIVRVLDYFEEGDSNTPCLVMEFIDGQNLFDLIENADQAAKSLHEEDAVNCIYQIGNALKSIHQNSIVHRDIHPGNIMLRSDKQPILIDFGLAGDIAPARSSSKKFGNENFAPYEQMQGSKEITVDIYGLAATLYYAVTGEYPTTSWDRKYHNAELTPPKAHCNISNNLNQAILAGMALEAQDRPQTMQEWLRMLGKQSVSLQTEYHQIDLVEREQNKLLDQNLVDQDDDLSSDTGVDYRKLRDLLAAGNWEDADYETYLVMLQALGRKEGDWIRDEELLNFPCIDLCTIDNLWVKYSNRKFGFSVQKRIYLECGGIPDGKYYKEPWEKFSDRVGWRIKEEWITYKSLTYSTSSYTGHLPHYAYRYCYRITRTDTWIRVVGVWSGGGCFFSRIQTCKL
jgi:serine/threonine-protein kinase